MKKWEIWTYPIPSDKEPHPFVIISPTRTCELKDNLNALECVSLRPGMEAKAHHVVLDTSDGLDNRTVVDCSFVYTVSKKKLYGKRGDVSPVRRNKIAKVRFNFLMDA